ncbi:MAG: DNA translocase FtsK 4TM domain-containing protein, partial [Gemmataceae bacterium]|nr:DNA translocase FtsK 4TM domain-containing protein [Gemmataceae bacterium]
MADRRATTRFDLCALALFLCGLLVALAVYSYGPVERVFYPPSEARSSNLLGKPGDQLAQYLFAGLGNAVHILLASCFVLVLMLLVRKNWLAWTRRLLGWLLLVPCVAIAADFAGQIWPHSAISNGGAAGAWLHAFFKNECSPVGGIALYAAGLGLGLMLALDFVVLGIWSIIQYLIHRFALAAGRLWLGLNAIAQSRRARRRARAKEKPFDSKDIPIHYLQSNEQDPETVEEEPAEGEPTILPIVRNQHELPPADDEHRFDNYELPPLSLLEDPEPFPYEEHDQRLRERATLLEKTFTDFDLNVKVVGINTGPVITQYEVVLETGMRVNKVTTLADDLAVHLKVPSVRVVAPIPGKNTVGIEVPNDHRAVVRLKEVLLGAGRKAAKFKVPLFLGKDTEGRPLLFDLADMPHLLIAGSTGTGKSVCMNAIILSMLMTRRPDEIKMIMIDPKMTELTEYGKIPHLMHPVVKDMKKAEAILAWAVDKMEERYDLLSRARVRHISVYNELGREEIHRRLQPDEEEAK